MPYEYKLAILRPLLKKIGLALLLPNYRPVSNLQYISKVVERSVAVQLVGHMKGNKLFDKFQSAYLEGWSVETALVRVQNDILTAIDQQQVTAVILLDLSAAFDTVSHKILLHRLEHRCGITGGVLSWIKSYLSDRRQVVKINDDTSKIFDLNCGVPQGSVLGPLLFIIYILPLGDIIQSNNILYHLFADDNQDYLSFKTDDAPASLIKMSNCVNEIIMWLTANDLKCNEQKTDFIICGTAQQLAKLNNPSINICVCTIEPSLKVRNLGGIFDHNMSMQAHVSAVSKSAYFQLFNISRIRKSLTKEAASICIHAFVTSKLDSCNALLCGLPKSATAKLQRVQNAAARLLIFTKKRDHITPILKQLHWLPIRRRSQYKILLITYKALNGLGPEYIQDLIEPYVPQKSLRSASDGLLLQQSRSKLKIGERSFCRLAPALWNELPFNIRSKVSVESFKAGIKTHLFTLEYEV